MIDPINKLIDTVEFDAVFYSLDWHPADHVSFIDNIKQRPIHPTSPVSIDMTFITQLNTIMMATHDCIINPHRAFRPLHDDYCNLYRFMGVMTTKRYMNAVHAWTQHRLRLCANDLRSRTKLLSSIVEILNSIVKR